MRIRAILTDLDGTLLEPDASVHHAVAEVLGLLARLRVPVCPVTSKTPAELEPVLRQLGLTGPAGFENGAGIWRGDGSVTLGAGAVPVADLQRVLAMLRTRTPAPIRSLKELSDRELSAITGLSGEALIVARHRVATLPLVVPPAHDELLREALPAEPPVRLIRGNRFLHLQGRHDKADVVPLLLEAVGPREGATVACGDAPNDVGLLGSADVAVIVPSATGPDRMLVERFPEAVVAPLPHGRGWAAAIMALVEERP